MNIPHLAQFKNSKEKIASLFDRDKGRLEFTAHRDWAAIAVAFATLAPILVGVGLFTFVQVNIGDVFSIEQKDVVLTETLNKERLDAAVLRYEKRAQEFEALFLRRPALPVDPSQ